MAQESKEEADLRKRVTRVVNEGGATQREISDAMGVSESWLSRWMSGEKTRGITYDARVRFEAFVNKRTKVWQETQRVTIESSSSAGSGFPATDTGVSPRAPRGRGRS